MYQYKVVGDDGKVKAIEGLNENQKIRDFIINYDTSPDHNDPILKLEHL